MKKIVWLVGLLLLCAVWLAPGAAAEAGDELLRESGALELPAEGGAGEFFTQNGLSWEKPDSLLSLSPRTVLSSFWNTLRAQLTAPLRLGGILLTVTILSALAGGLGDSVKDKSLERIFALICVLVCVGVITQPVGDCFALAADTLQSGGTFMLAFVPVFAAVTAAGGGIVTASVYRLIVLTVAQLAAQLAVSCLLPLLQIAFALAIVDALHPAISLAGLLEAIKKCVSWAMGLMMAVLVGLLTVQGIVGTAADGVATKATKFMLSSCVPVVGGAVSDAYGTVRGSIGVVRGGVGAMGIAALAALVLPPLVALLAYRFCFFGAGLAAELLDAQPLRRLFRNLETIFSLAAGVVACFSFMLLLSTALMILLLGNG